MDAVKKEVKMGIGRRGEGGDDLIRSGESELDLRAMLRKFC